MCFLTINLDFKFKKEEKCVVKEAMNYLFFVLISDFFLYKFCITLLK